MPATTLTDRALIRLSGDDVAGFVQGLVTGDVNGAPPMWSALLTPQGKVIADFFIWKDRDDIVLDCADLEVEPLIQRLSLYRLRRAITIEREPALAVHWAPDGDLGHPDPRLPALGRRWLDPAGTPATGYLEHRLRLGVCEGRAELGDLLWLECNAVELNGVSFAKGCFVGQENTARMNWRSKVNRRLFVCRGDADASKGERIAYTDLGLKVVHARIDAIPDTAIIPDWLKPSLTS